LTEPTGYAIILVSTDTNYLEVNMSDEVICRDCGWQGNSAETINMGDRLVEDYRCPMCASSRWFYVNDADPDMKYYVNDGEYYV
jgi:hypothetical protein